MKADEYNIAVKTHSHHLYRFILKMIKDEDEAKDVVQDAYLKLWKDLEKIDFNKCKSWLFTTAYHTMINKIKKNSRQEPLDQSEEPYASNDQYETKEIIDKALEYLPEIQRSVILLRDLEGYDYKEIGSILNLNESQVKVYLFRARKKLKDIIKDKLAYHENN